MDVKIVAIGALALLESVAMLTHTDSVYFSLVVALIAGLSGYTIGVVKVSKKEVK